MPIRSITDCRIITQAKLIHSASSSPSERPRAIRWRSSSRSIGAGPGGGHELGHRRQIAEAAFLGRAVLVFEARADQAGLGMFGHRLQQPVQCPRAQHRIAVEQQIERRRLRRDADIVARRKAPIRRRPDHPRPSAPAIRRDRLFDRLGGTIPGRIIDDDRAPVIAPGDFGGDRPETTDRQIGRAVIDDDDGDAQRARPPSIGDSLSMRALNMVTLSESMVAG